MPLQGPPDEAETLGGFIPELRRALEQRIGEISSLLDGKRQSSFQKLGGFLADKTGCKLHIELQRDENLIRESTENQ